MATRSAICIKDENGIIRGRYVHFDGDLVGEQVSKIVQREGVERAIQVLIHDHWSWTYLDPAQLAGQLSSSYDDRFAAVEGYGAAMVDPEEASPNDWIFEVGQAGTEYLWLIEPSGKVVRV